MSLNEFIENKKIMLNSFGKNWCSRHAENPSNYPDEMNENDWEEQFSSYCYDPDIDLEESKPE